MGVERMAAHIDAEQLFSHASLSMSETSLPAGSDSFGDVANAPKRESCGAVAVASRWKASMVSICSSNVPRAPSESSAPHLMSDSSDLRFRFFDPTRERNPDSVLNGPFVFRSKIIASEMPSPKFLMDDKPKRTESFVSRRR